jgi:hypothetical protein
MKTFKVLHSHPKIVVGLGLIIVIFLAEVAMHYILYPGYVLFVYYNDHSNPDPYVTGIESGFSSLKSCQEQGVQYLSSMMRPVPFIWVRCATGCPRSAYTVKDCKNPARNMIIRNR